MWTVEDADGDGIHVECKLALDSGFTSGWYWRSALGQTDWEEAADPHETWTALPSAGATSGTGSASSARRLHDTYWLGRLDGILYSEWSPLPCGSPGHRALTAPSGPGYRHRDQDRGADRRGGEHHRV